MYKYGQLLKVLMLLPLLLLLSGCPLPYSSSRSSEENSHLSYRFNQDYPPVKNYRILLFVPSYSYIDLYMVGGTLQDGPSPNIQMTLSSSSGKTQNKSIELRTVVCFYVRPGRYDFLFENEHIMPKKIEKNILINQFINIININASGLYGSANLSVRQLQLPEALPFIYGEWVSREKCKILDL